MSDREYAGFAVGVVVTTAVGVVGIIYLFAPEFYKKLELEHRGLRIRASNFSLRIVGFIICMLAAWFYFGLIQTVFEVDARERLEMMWQIAGRVGGLVIGIVGAMAGGQLMTKKGVHRLGFMGILPSIADEAPGWRYSLGVCFLVLSFAILWFSALSHVLSMG